MTVLLAAPTCRPASTGDAWQPPDARRNAPRVAGAAPAIPTMENDKLFIITRSDLPPGAMLAQSCHAMRAFSAEHPDADMAWYRGSNNLAVLEAPDEAALLALAERARAARVPVSVFREPDFDDAVTAIAVGPSGRRLTSCLPLALRPKKAA